MVDGRAKSHTCSETVTVALPTTGGTPGLRTQTPATTAPSLQKLLDAGAIDLVIGLVRHANKVAAARKAGAPIAVQSAYRSYAQQKTTLKFGLRPASPDNKPIIQLLEEPRGFCLATNAW